MPGYITGYVITSNIPGMGLNENQGLIARAADFMPPDRLIRRRSQEGMGQWAGFIQDIGVQVERGRTCSFIVQESIPVLEAYQGIRTVQAGPNAGDAVLFTAGFVTEDFDGGIGNENYLLRGHILDTDKAARPGEGGGPMTVLIYLNAWTKYAAAGQIVQGGEEERVRHLDFDSYPGTNLMRDITWAAGTPRDVMAERNRALGFTSAKITPVESSLPPKTFALV